MCPADPVDEEGTTRPGGYCVSCGQPWPCLDHRLHGHESTYPPAPPAASRTPEPGDDDLMAVLDAKIISTQAPEHWRDGKHQAQIGAWLDGRVFMRNQIRAALAARSTPRPEAEAKGVIRYEFHEDGTYTCTHGTTADALPAAPQPTGRADGQPLISAPVFRSPGKTKWHAKATGSVNIGSCGAPIGYAPDRSQSLDVVDDLCGNCFNVGRIRSRLAASTPTAPAEQPPSGFPEPGQRVFSAPWACFRSLCTGPTDCCNPLTCGPDLTPGDPEIAAEG